MADRVEVTERLYLTADGSRLVPEGDPDAATLFATPNKGMSAEDAEKYGYGPKKAPKPADKQSAAPANKGRRASS